MVVAVLAPVSVAVVVPLIAVLLPIAVVSTLPVTVVVITLAVIPVAIRLPVAVVVVVVVPIAVVSTVPMTVVAAAIAVPIVIVLVPVGILAVPVFVVPVVIAVVLRDHDRAACLGVTCQRGAIHCVALLTHAGQGGVLPTREANAQRESGGENESRRKWAKIMMFLRAK